MREAGEIVFLRLVQICQKRAGRSLPAGEIGDPERGHRRGAEVLQQDPAAHGGVVVAGVERRQRRVDLGPQELRIDPRQEKSFIAQNLGRMIPQDLVHQPLTGRDLRHEEVARRDVGDGDAAVVRVVEHGKDVVIRLLIQRRDVDVGAGRHDPDDVALHDALRELRVLELLADRDLVALVDEACEVAVHGVERDAAHRRALREAAVLAGERQLQLSGDRHGVLEEHLVKVAEPVKQDAVGIFFSRCDILLHHRREQAHVDVVQLHGRVRLQYGLIHRLFAL